MIYLESIETATGKGNENDQNGISFRREKFRQHILQSTCVQFSYLLSRLESSSAGADLHYEKAILYGKVSTYILDVLWCQPIKLIQVVSTSEFHEY